MQVIRSFVAENITVGGKTDAPAQPEIVIRDQPPPLERHGSKPITAKGAPRAPSGRGPRARGVHPASPVGAAPSVDDRRQPRIYPRARFASVENPLAPARFPSFL